jgi:xanthine dehydrogenase YagR molybdenum-binding subunit
MPEYNWPEEGKRSLIGKRHQRVDGPAKVSGQAKYTQDINRPGMLYARSYRCPYAHARITSIDTSEAEKMPGVKKVRAITGRNVGWEILNALEDVVVVVAESEEQAEDAVRKVQVGFERLPHLVKERDVQKAGDRAKPGPPAVAGEPDKAFAEADVVSEGYYGIPFISHSTPEPHGAVAEWQGDQLTVWLSTQGVSGAVTSFAMPLGIQNTDVRAICNYIGGAFGSKLQVDVWCVEAARLARELGRPVKFMLERPAEQFIAGGRPSDFARIRLAAKKDGTVTGWDSETWGTSGPAGGGSPPLPYVFRRIPNTRTRFTGVVTNIGASRAWRAPNHPQACFLTMSALDDCAAKLNMDPLEFFLKNIPVNVPPTGVGRPEDYTAELQKAAELIEWKKNWHPRGDKTPGPIKRGLGLSVHTWAGLGHTSQCEVKIHPDGSVEVSLASQDLGTGTRTIIAEVVAETFGLPLKAVKVNIGESTYPPSGSSGGSTTVGGVGASTRRGSQDALQQLFEKVASALAARPDQLEAVNGKIQVVGNPAKALTWKEACAKIGVNPIVVTGRNPGAGRLIDQNVAGAQMADVSVDIETGIVTMNKFVAVQDCGLILNLTTAESQVVGAMVMGVTYSLFEERVMDQATGRMLNNDMEFYKLAGLGDIGAFQVHMMTGKGFDERGVIGLGEPPVISPGAAIANAVANAIGVRVPELPLTPERVLAALEKGGVA